MSKEGRSTSFDIAFRAGVSQSTVSRALRNSPLVNRETRDRIQAIARELNYQADRNAANLRSRQTRTLALLIFEDPTSDDSLINPFFLAMLGNTTRAAARRGYDLLLSFQQLSNDWHRDYELSGRADGLILLGYGDYLSYREKLEHLATTRAHFVIWGPHLEKQPNNSLYCDNLKGARDATRHLLDLGHRQIAFIGEATERYPELQLRYQGHLQALEQAGIPSNPDLQVDADNREIAGYQAVRHLLESNRPFTAVFAASDLMAIGAMKALRQDGIRVPDDVAVVGFDDIPAASYVTPALTTVHQDTIVAGQLLVDKLIRLIEGKPVESTLIPATLVIRESSGCAAS